MSVGMLGLLPALLLAAVLRGPEPVSASGSSGDRIASPAVVASWIVQSRAGEPALVLLILWRGTPGWFLKEGSQQSGGTTATIGRKGQSFTQRLQYGGIDLDVAFDPAAGVAQIVGREVALGDSIVVLEDEVDGADGPRVVRTLRAETPLSNPDAAVEETVRASKELQDYLRCDARVPDDPVQQMLNALCARMTAPTPPAAR